jgi:hypothetical protein
MHIFSDLLFPILRKGRSVLRRGEEWFEKQTATVSEAPIIVLGNQKSGTSAIAHLLADYGGLSKTIDIPPLWGYEGLRIMHGRRRFSAVVEENPHYFSTEVIKEPMMTFFVEQVVEQFPEAQYVFVVRDPRDNIRSLLNSRDLPGDRATLSEQDSMHLSPPHVLLDADAWRVRADNYVELLSKRWILATRAVKKLRDAGRPLKVLRYEDFMSDKLESIRRMAESLSIEKRNSISDKLDVPFQPSGNRKVRWDDFYGEYNLSTIHDICAEEMREFEYDNSRVKPTFL